MQATCRKKKTFPRQNIRRFLTIKKLHRVLISRGRPLSPLIGSSMSQSRMSLP